MRQHSVRFVRIVYDHKFIRLHSRMEVFFSTMHQLPCSISDSIISSFRFFLDFFFFLFQKTWWSYPPFTNGFREVVRCQVAHGLKIFILFAGDLPTFHKSQSVNRPWFRDSSNILRATVDDGHAPNSLGAMRLPPTSWKSASRISWWKISSDGWVGAIRIQCFPAARPCSTRRAIRLFRRRRALQLLGNASRPLLAQLHFRVWTQERSPFWKHFSLPPAVHLSFCWPVCAGGMEKEFDVGWAHLQRKNEKIISAALENIRASWPP